VSVQLYDDTKIQKIRVLLSNGTVGSFFGPLQLDHKIEDLAVVQMEVFEPYELPKGITWFPVPEKRDI